MDLRQLNALVAVADHRSFSAAARALHTVQSNVSTHIARLERELGATLVDRRSGELTLEGASVVSRARRIQSELQSIDGDVAAMRDEVRGAVRVGMIGTTARWLVPRVLDSLEAAHPAVQIIIVDATTTSLLPQVADGLLELALVQLPVEHPDIETEPAFEEDAIVLVPTEHPLAEHDEIDLAELARHRILASPAGISFRSMLDEICRREGIELDIRAEIDGMRLLASLAVSGYAPAVVPSTAAPRWLRGDFKRVVLKAPARRSVGLIRSRRTTLSAPARAAREAIRAALTETAGDQHGVTLTLED